jgi:hypothetical protein
VLVPGIRIFDTRWFARFARHEGIDDASLREAIERAGRGLIDADLGGGLIKQRVARQGAGLSGGYRVIVAYRAKSRAVFLVRFAKSERENVSADELEFLPEIAGNWLAADAAKIRRETEAGNLQEIEDDKET